ncbi:sugar phosphate nucleotidyltransferase [Aeromonas sp. QDB20]|nr:sugar phosphate nucleotidyltransferase [Aeromonas sp. QDB20]
MCGGSGSRLWPISREQHPKPFIKLSIYRSIKICFSFIFV